MRDDGERLADILDACRRVQRIVAKGAEHVRREDEAQLALVHLIPIIGEAVSRISAELRSTHGYTPWPQIATMRNQVVHRYLETS